MGDEPSLVTCIAADFDSKASAPSRNANTDVETNWSVTGIDDTWLLVLVASSIGVLLLGALLAMFLLKCREMNLFGGSDRCTLHSREHREIMKHTDTRDCSVLSNGNKLAIPSDAVLYHGTPNLQDNRLMWAALTPRGTQHFISENYPRNLIKYDESDDHYETIEPLRAEPGHSVATTRGYDQYETYQKDYDYEDPTPLIESYQMGSMDNPENHHYQIIGNPDMRCIGMSIGPSLKRPASISRPRVSSPTRIEHPNLPPLNLYPHKMSTLRRNTMSYRSADGTIPKYSI
ncbi:uncharacterized protein LOC132701370 isoform X2 [Cylas formicarius]|uniref:uncharacterized protein LOC132701370 isoform X2 n=1 Tax=Cylas formicarius TaxID=197179 RepID=UPI002958A4AD|nr:uncharacterized protein LOC132701370 isoform X2 [Cylas formicarius]